MVLLSDSGELSVRYATYIQELQEFFALHDVLCGAPRELGFFAARLSGRDSFPGELASMVRSFIFREGGSIPLDDLRTVVALAVGGSAVADYAHELQHPLHDLSAFLASVARVPLDQPPPAPIAEEPEAPVPTVETRSYAFPTFSEPTNSANPFPSYSSFDTALAPPVPAASDLQRTDPIAPPNTIASNRRFWAATAVGLPLLLLAAFLYHQSAAPATAPYPESQVASSVAATASTAAAHAIPQTPLATASATLAQPTYARSSEPAALLPSTVLKPNAAAHATYVQPSTSPTPPSQPSTLLAGTSSSLRGGPDPTHASVVPTAAPAASLSPAGPSHPLAPASTPHPLGPASLASVSAHQASFGVSSGIMTSHLLSSSQPQYPRMAGMAHVEGEVILQAVVSKTGKVSAVHVLSGHRLLRKAAVNAVRKWRYRPYVSQGTPVDVATIISLDVKPPH